MRMCVVAWLLDCACLCACVCACVHMLACVELLNVGKLITVAIYKAAVGVYTNPTPLTIICLNNIHFIGVF